MDVCVYRSQSLTHDEKQEIIEQITKIIIKENHELVVVGDWNLPDVSWDIGIVKCPTGTANKPYIQQKNFLDMFNYKKLTWLLDDSHVTRRRLVDGKLQESLLDQILVSNIDMSRDFKVVPPIGKSYQMEIIFEIKCNNNKDTVMRVKKNWGKFSKTDFKNIALRI